MPRKKIGTPAPATVVSEESVAAVVASPAPQAAPQAAPPGQAELGLDQHEAALAQLGQERITNAQLHLQNRQKELEGLLMQLKGKYEDGGKFRMTHIDIPRGVITRHPA
jgi:hypothetical protein